MRRQATALVIELWGKNRLKADSFIGRAVLDLATYTADQRGAWRPGIGALDTPPQNTARAEAGAEAAEPEPEPEARPRSLPGARWYRSMWCRMQPSAKRGAAFVSAAPRLSVAIVRLRVQSTKSKSPKTQNRSQAMVLLLSLLRF